MASALCPARRVRWLVADRRRRTPPDSRSELSPRGTPGPWVYRGIGLESAGRGHNGRTDPNHAKTCQRQPEAAPQALLRREKAEVGMEILGRGHGDTPTNLSPSPPGPKLGQLCRLVELVAAAMLLARRRQRGLDGRRASTHTIACDRLANGSREPLWCFRNRRWLATSRSRPGAVPPRG